MAAKIPVGPSNIPSVPQGVPIAGTNRVTQLWLQLFVALRKVCGTNTIERMDSAKRTAITAIPLTLADAGLTIYNTTTNKLNVWNGTAWEVVTSV